MSRYSVILSGTAWATDIDTASPVHAGEVIYLAAETTCYRVRKIVHVPGIGLRPARSFLLVAPIPSAEQSDIEKVVRE